MGLHAVIKGIVSRMEKVDTMNMNALEKWRKRALSIAKDLGQRDDKLQQQSFETAITNIAQLFLGVSVNHPDTIMYRLEPETQENRERALIEGDEILNTFQVRYTCLYELRHLTLLHFDRLYECMRYNQSSIHGLIQPPSPGRSQVMKAAALEDEELLKRNLKGLNGLSNTDLIEIRDHAATSDAPNYRNYSLAKLYQKQSMTKAQRAHAKLVQKLHWINAEGVSEPSLVVGVCDMRDDSEIERYLISLEATFGELVEVILGFDNAASLPDFWCKRNDSSKNQVTESATWWECQTAGTRVVDAIMDRRRGENRSSINETREKRNVEIRSVLSDGEYLIALVAKDGAESGVPVDIPRNHRQAASIHFQEKVFPNDKVDRLLLMETGIDASSMIFDKRLFGHQSNPLFVELHAAAEGKGKERMD